MSCLQGADFQNVLLPFILSTPLPDLGRIGSTKWLPGRPHRRLSHAFSYVSASFPALFSAPAWNPTSHFKRYHKRRTLPRALAGNFDPARESLDLLEWPEISRRVAGYASTELGRRLFSENEEEEPRNRLYMLEVAEDVERAKRLLAETREVFELEYRLNRVMDFKGVNDDAVEAVKKAGKGVPMKGKELLAVAELLATARRMRRCVEGAIAEGENKDRFPVLKDMVQRFRTWPEVERKICDMLDEFGDVRDGADPVLTGIRQGMRELLSEIKGTLNDLMDKHSNAMQERLITTRYDRFVIPVKISRKGDFRGGIVHDVSSSGSTAYVEPGIARGKNDKLRQFVAREKARVQAILRELSEQVVAPIIDDLMLLQETLAVIDAATARARFSNAIEGVDVDFDNSKCLRLKGVRHPLLFLRAVASEKASQNNSVKRGSLSATRTTVIQKEQVVPLDFLIGDDVRCVVVTGPNTGGKTVALKTLGVVALMARAGLFIPAKITTNHGNYASAMVTLPFFDQVLADIGDNQSLIQSLSTFSGHVERVKRIIASMTTSSLVLLDEIGSGTDPAEGSALGIALLRYLSSRAALTVATTHHGELKTLKYDKSDGFLFENVSVEFDERTFAPTYKLLWGIPGRSNALAIASRLGLANDIISAARELLRGGSESKVDIESIIEALRRQTSEAEQRSRESAKAQREALDLRGQLQERVDALRAEEEKLRSAQQQAVQDDIDKAKREIASVIREMQRQGSTSKAAADAQTKIDKIAARNLGVEEDGYTQNVKIDLNSVVQGVMVRVPKFGRKPLEVLEVQLKKGEKGDIVAALGTMRVRVRPNEIVEVLRPVSTAAGSRRMKMLQEKRNNVKPESRLFIKSPANTLDVRGETVDEASAKLDFAISRAMSYGTLYVIHGHGTGKLREGIRQWMNTCPNIEKFEDAKPNEGGSGATVAYLK